MISLTSSKNYIVIKDKKELELAKACDICRYIILEDNNVIYIWTRLFGKWVKEKYVAFFILMAVIVVMYIIGALIYRHHNKKLNASVEEEEEK